MKCFKWRRIRIALPLGLCAATLMLTLHILGVSLQAPQNPAAPPTATGAGAAAGQQGTRGARGARGAGGGAARGGPVLGDGPWDYGEGENRVHVTVVTKGVDHPWAMAFLPNGDMLVTERAGRLRVIRNGKLDPTPVAGLPQIRVGGLGGLLDVVLHPNFPQNRLIYLAYSKPGDEEPANSSLAIYRAKWDGGPTLTEGRDIFVTQPRFGARGSSPANCCGQGPSRQQQRRLAAGIRQSRVSLCDCRRSQPWRMGAGHNERCRKNHSS